MDKFIPFVPLIIAAICLLIALACLLYTRQKYSGFVALAPKARIDTAVSEARYELLCEDASGEFKSTGVIFQASPHDFVLASHQADGKSYAARRVGASP